MQVPAISDQVLIRQYLDGEESALETLINRHKRKVFSHIYLLVKDNDLAQDIFQDTFIKVVNTLKLGKYNEEGKFLPWVMRIAHNLAIDYFRKAKKMPYARSDEDYDVFGTIEHGDKNVEETLVEDQIHSDVRKLIDLLPEEQREVVIMRHFKGLSFKEIAEQSDVSINTALGRMRYALLNLRKLIKEKNITLQRF